MMRSFTTAIVCVLATTNVLRADPPGVSYIFPAGGQRGATVQFHVGGLALLSGCPFEMIGPGVEASKRIQKTQTRWLEGPVLTQPDSQRAEDYPKDYAGQVKIAADSALGLRTWRVWNAQGAAPSMKFMVGDLPEIMEEEIDGEPIPVAVQLPLTINGRIFPYEDIDIYQFEAKRGQTINCEVHAARLGSPLDARLQVLDARGKPLAENDDWFGSDPLVRFTAPDDGTYQVKIHDVDFHGGPAFVYRLTLTTNPYLDWVYPLGGRRGQSVTFEAGTRAPLPLSPGERGEKVVQQVVQLPALGPSDHAFRFNVAGKLSNPLLLELDNLSEVLEVEPNDSPEQVKPLAVPAMWNGRIAKPGDVDFWAVTMSKGEVLDFDLSALRLGSPLTAVLSVQDDQDKVLGKTDASSAPLTDPRLKFTAPADGVYYVRVAEQFHSRGGPAFAYRLRVDHPDQPDFRLQLGSDALTLNRGGEARLKLTVERLGGFSGPIPLVFENLPHGVAVIGTTVPAGQSVLDIVFKETPAALLSGSHLRIRGVAQVGDYTLTRRATFAMPRGMEALDTVLLAVAQPAPFKIKGEHDFRWASRGTQLHRHYAIERGGYQGPLVVTMADRQMRHLQGVTGPTITVPAGVSEFDYYVQLPPWMELGRTARAVVQAVGIVQDADGSEHEVCFSSIQPSEQITVVVEPGSLSVETERSSITALPGKTITVPVRVARGKSLHGSVKVEVVVPTHVHGVGADVVTIPADQSSATLSLRCAADKMGPFNRPLVIRATLMDKGEPILAETKIDVQLGR